MTRSPEMERVIRLGERAAKSAIPVLLEGESGVGKEVVARAIQGSSDRRGKPFVTVNCGAIPQNLIESILFGHERVRSPARRSAMWASSWRPRAERCSSTRSASFRWKRR